MKPYSNLQEIFNIAYLGLAKQNWRRAMSITDGGRPACAYRGNDGLKCAIGHCVPDELVTEGTTTKTVHRLLNGYLTGMESEWTEKPNAEWNELFKNVSFSALQELQHCHDHACAGGDATVDVTDLNDKGHMKNRLHRFAERFYLTIPQLELETI